MNKSAKNSVAIFLAAALIAGVFSVSSPSIIDTEATEEKKYGYEKEKRYAYGEEEKKYGNDGRDNKYGEEEKKYGNDGRDNKYGEEEKKYGNDGRDGRDNKHGEEEKKYGYGSEDKSVKYVSCKNININGGDSFQKGGDPRGDYGDMSSRGGEEQSYNSDWFSMNRDTGMGKPDYIKETNKDVTVICIQNNNAANKTVEEDGCEGCIAALSNGQRMQLETDLDEKVPSFLPNSIEELCEAVNNGDISPILLSLTIHLAEGTGPLNQNLAPHWETLLDCLTDILNENESGGNGPRG